MVARRTCKYNTRMQQQCISAHRTRTKILYYTPHSNIILYCYVRIEVLRVRTRRYRRRRRSSSGPSARTFGFRTQRPAAAPREIKHTPSSADCIINTPQSPWRRYNVSEKTSYALKPRVHDGIIVHTAPTHLITKCVIDKSYGTPRLWWRWWWRWWWSWGW